MEYKEIILKSLGGDQQYLAKVLDGLTQEEVTWSPKPECNSIAWTLWHTTREEDYFVSCVIQDKKELYEAEGWQEKLGTPVKFRQYTVEELQAWSAPKLEDLKEYASSVRKKTLAFINSVPNEKLFEVPHPDSSPDSIGDILLHIRTEAAFHVGQIGYLRGMQRGLDK